MERQLGKLAQQEAKLHTQMEANAEDYEQMAELNRKLQDLAAQKDSLELEWLEASEILE